MTMYLTLALIVGIIIFLAIVLHYIPFLLWLSAKASGVHISLVQLFLMRIRKGFTLRSGNEQNALNILWMRVRTATALRLKAESGKLDMLELRVRKGDPLATLRPGSAYVLLGNRPVESAADLTPGDRLDLMLRDGTARCLIESVDRK